MFVRRLYDYPTRGTNPFAELERMRNEMERLFEGATSSSPGRAAAGVFPLINVTEDKETYRVRAELPGIKADDLDISLTGKSLAISGERKLDQEDKDAKYHRRERDAGRFQRMVSLPGDVDGDKVSASCENGVLTVTLPKAETAKPRQISVK
jgi:HSP20 family protein